jgi:PPP family 3-phenylpropionic acid transporter
VLLFAQLLHAATFACFHAAAIQFVQSHFDRRRQGQAQSLYAALSGAGGALGALYAGYAWQVSGALAAFAGASLAALAGAFLILLSVRRTLHDPAA